MRRGTMVALDCSGSMHRDMTPSAMLKLVELTKGPRMQSIGFDTEIHEGAPKALRGGTDFNCVIKRFRKSDYAKLIIVTDGYAPTPETTPWLRKRLTWLVPEGYNKEVDRLGTVITY